MQGTPTAPVRRWLRRGGAALVAALPIVGGLLPLPEATAATAAPAGAHAAPPPSAAHSSTARAAAAKAGSTTAAQAAQATRTAHAADARRSSSHSGGAEISVSSLSPTAPVKGDTLTVTGTVANNSRTAIADGKVGLRVGPVLGGRSSIEDAARHADDSAGPDGTPVHDKHATADVPAVHPGDSAHFRMKVPVSALKLGRDGVHQIGVTLAGRTSGHHYSRPLATARSFLPWQADSSPRKTKLTYLWPLISTPHLTARSESDEQQTPVFRDDRLAKDLAPGGRLREMVDQGKKLPVTWVVDPDLLATVDAMRKPYRVQKAGGGTRPGKGQKYAKDWLNDLQHILQGKDKKVVALPFADPDLASLAHRGQAVPGALGQLRPSTQRGVLTVETTLHVKPDTDYAWPVDGAVDRSIRDVATAAGAHKLIARSDSLRDPSLSSTPSAPRPVGSGTTALVADARLSRMFEGDMSKRGATSQAVQQFLAETQSITAQAPTKQRSLLVAPQRMPTAGQARAMAKAIDSVETADRWAQSSELSETATAKPDPGANTRLPGLAQYPSALRRQELPTKAYRKMHRTQGVLDDFQQVLQRSSRVITPFGNSMDREVSNSWREDPRAGRHFRESVEDYLVGLTKKVKLIQKSSITLSGRSATIPVTVQNNLVQGVEGLRLKLTSSRRIGLDVGTSQPVKVDGGHSQSVKFDTTAKANGRAYVEAQLYTKDGKPYGKPMRFRVNVTSITSAVMLVIAGGVLLVVLAGVRMYTARKRKHREEAAATASGGGDGGGGDGDGGPDGGADGDNGDGPRGTTDGTGEGAAESDGSNAADSDGDDDSGDGDQDAGGINGKDDKGAATEPARRHGTAPDARDDTGRESGTPSGASGKVDR